MSLLAKRWKAGAQSNAARRGIPCPVEGYDRKPVWDNSVEITPAKRGYYGETWKVKGNAGCYFLKMDYLSYHQKKFQNSLAVID